ncbi:fumarylacetoacetate hydrolase family protein [Mycolicibacterium holsaticum]|uniref:2-hydroxyhepta-2,4-diene-1,7-dioate isomerase n=1 Tax=Mycolicibacterium holsaticum TaxID=152142 RepID=A0A1E3RTS5_9MYCO|nr:fumarylacetoacetate hydrolase family protein [Mycolicibacterium holsaticum]ODQ93316.1 2-hydroxyhepta-2,4-diene-1,7-dioate isomerase [Mycolicibacterium holsaticum]
MRLATLKVNGATAAGRVTGDEVTLLPFADVGDLLASGPGWAARAADGGEHSIPLRHAEFATLIPHPEKVLCVGANYQDHLDEVGLDVPQFPTLFAKYSRSLIGSGDVIVLPANSQAVDWEVELGVVIGAELRHADAKEALSAVAGYTIVNDVSMRDWQLRTSQFLQGKAFEAATPVGPYLVTPDEVADPGDLRITCAVDGEVKQDSNTGRMLFSVAEIVSYISSFITLVPGDLIATGTPAGVGAACQPPEFLTPGRVMQSTIAGLGQQVNMCVAAAG